MDFLTALLFLFISLLALLLNLACAFGMLAVTCIMILQFTPKAYQLHVAALFEQTGLHKLYKVFRNILAARAARPSEKI